MGIDGSVIVKSHVLVHDPFGEFPVPRPVVDKFALRSGVAVIEDISIAHGDGRSDTNGHPAVSVEIDIPCKCSGSCEAVSPVVLGNIERCGGKGRDGYITSGTLGFYFT